MKVHLADVLATAGGIALIVTGSWWMQAVGVACLVVVGVVVVRRARRAAEAHRWAGASREGR